MAERVLITGGNGFIGRYLCKELQTRGKEILVISKSFDEPFCYPHRQISLDNKEGLIEVLKQFHPDAIMHLAAIALVTHKDVSEIYNVNVCGTENLFEAAKEAGLHGVRIVITSTAGVYGNQPYKYLDESLPFNPVNHYSYSKMICEVMSRQYESDFDIKIVRPFNIIGIGQNNTFFVPKVVEAFCNKQEKLKLGNIDSVRDYVDVSYCAYIMAELLCRKQVSYSILNICSGIPTSCKDIINKLNEITGFTPKIEISQSFVRSNEIWRMVGSSARLQDFVDGHVDNLGINTILTNMVQKYMMDRKKNVE